MITLQTFEKSLLQDQPPQNLSVYLQSLWYDAKGDWDKAHSLIDNLSDNTAYNLHAYLHRVEGDNDNAGYWYMKAGRHVPDISLKKEWKQLVQGLLEQEEA